MPLSDRILAVERSPFYSIMELAAQRDDCLYLQLGEPDYVTPKHILDAAKRAMDEGHTHYGPDRGAPELRQLIVDKIRRQDGAEYSWEDEILVTAGGQAALHVAVMSMANPGDEIIILLPHYPPYLVNAQLSGATPVYVKLKSEDNFVPDPVEIEKVITPKSKLLIVLTPNNPTGAVYPRETLQALLDLAKKHNLTIISDEVYETLVFDGLEHTSMLSLPDAKDHVVQVNSFSKTYAMTGLRVGYIAASADKLIHFLKYHHTVNISANVPSQMACIEALKGPQDCVSEMRESYRERRDMLIPALNEVPGIHCGLPKGTFFAFADIRELGIASLDLAQYLVKEAGVVLTNGSGFDYEGFIRVSYAAKPEIIEEAMERMKKAMETLPASLKG